MSAKCTICGKTIVLEPSATERSHKFGGKASHYTSLFTQHNDCMLAKRSQDTLDLMRILQKH
jgi:hypothetical protein